MKIKINIKSRAVYCGLKNNDLAKALNMTAPNVSLLVNGKTKSITYDTLAKLCAVLKCQPNDILEIVQ